MLTHSHMTYGQPISCGGLRGRCFGYWQPPPPPTSYNNLWRAFIYVPYSCSFLFFIGFLLPFQSDIFLCVLPSFFFLLLVMFLPHTISSISFLTTRKGSPLQSQFLMLSNLTNISCMKLYTNFDISRVSVRSFLTYLVEIKKKVKVCNQSLM
jgi:hypothetical protein